MTLETTITILAVVAAVAVAFLVLRWSQAPKARTRRLAITVWAAFGPYDTAQDAEDFLRRASRTIFGAEGVTEHEEWIQGHVKNFGDWEAEGRFQGAHKMMRTSLLLTACGHAFEAACEEVKAEALAQGLEAMERLNKDLLEEGGHRLEAVKEPDGTVRSVYKQIWSDEEIRRKNQESHEAILNSIGRNLLEDKSDEAKHLLEFLSAVYEANTCKHLKTPKNVGVIWFACLEIVDKDPDSEVAKTFKVLNDAWAAIKSDNET